MFLCSTLLLLEYDVFPMQMKKKVIERKRERKRKVYFNQYTINIKGERIVSFICCGYETSRCINGLCKKASFQHGCHGRHYNFQQKKSCESVTRCFKETCSQKHSVTVKSYDEANSNRFQVSTTGLELFRITVCVHIKSRWFLIQS